MYGVRLGLKGRFMVCISAIIVAFWVVMTAYAVKAQNERLRSGLEERGRLLTTLLAANASDAMARFEVHELRRLLAEVTAQEHVLRAVVFDEQGRIVTDGTIKNPRRHQAIDRSIHRHVESSNDLLVEYEGDEMTVTRAVAIGGRPLGGVRVVHSLSGLLADQAALTRKTAAAGAIFALLGLAAVALLTEAVTRPLKEVTHAVRSLHAGQRAPILKIRSSDEVGELAAAFNEMTDRLHESTISLDYLDSVIEQVGECLLVTAPDGTVRRANLAACRLLGGPASDLVGRHCGELVRAPEGYASILHASASRPGAAGFETELLRVDGASVPVLASVSSIDDPSGRGLGFVVAASDITERLRVERQKDEFVTMVHHEVRTPLTAVRGAIGLLDGGVAGDLSQRAKELLAIALRNSERMERLVNDILVSRKLDAGRMDFLLERVELKPLVEQAVEAVTEYGQRHEVSFEFVSAVDRAFVRVDPDRLIQVVTNVLSNAVRFSPSGGVVRVTVHRVGELLQIAVADQGPGIDEAFRERIFEPFARGGDEDWRHKSGTGLGMSIAKAIIDELEGDIHFETESGAGTTFFIDVPEATGFGR
jgi:PAS domain S-box-containing protein